MSIIFIYFFVSTYRRVFIFTKNKLFPVKWITCSRSPEYVSVRAYAYARARYAEYKTRGRIRNLQKSKFVLIIRVDEYVFYTTETKTKSRVFSVVTHV